MLLLFTLKLRKKTSFSRNDLNPGTRQRIFKNYIAVKGVVQTIEEAKIVSG